jgi:hypothetical protein
MPGETKAKEGRILCGNDGGFVGPDAIVNGKHDGSVFSQKFRLEPHTIIYQRMVNVIISSLSIVITELTSKHGQLSYSMGEEGVGI